MAIMYTKLHCNSREFVEVVCSTNHFYTDQPTSLMVTPLYPIPPLPQHLFVEYTAFQMDQLWTTTKDYGCQGDRIKDLQLYAV